MYIQNGQTSNAPKPERCKWWLLGNGSRTYWNGFQVVLKVRIKPTTSSTPFGYSNHWATRIPGGLGRWFLFPLALQARQCDFHFTWRQWTNSVECAKRANLHHLASMRAWGIWSSIATGFVETTWRGISTVLPRIETIWQTEKLKKKPGRFHLLSAPGSLLKLSTNVWLHTYACPSSCPRS